MNESTTSKSIEKKIEKKKGGGGGLGGGDGGWGSVKTKTKKGNPHPKNLYLHLACTASSQTANSRLSEANPRISAYASDQFRGNWKSCTTCPIGTEIGTLGVCLGTGAQTGSVNEFLNELVGVLGLVHSPSVLRWRSGVRVVHVMLLGMTVCVCFLRGKGL